MWLMYLLINDFGWAVILFTLLVKAASFPLTLKQQKNMAVSQLFTPRVQEIQRKHRGNQQKLSEEMQKLQKEGYNPMGGCGPMILTMIILFGVLDVVYKPMTHIERFDKDVIQHSVELSKQTEFTSLILDNPEDLAAFLEYRGISTPRGPRNSEVSAVSNEQRREIGEYIFNNMSVLNQTGISDTTIRAISSADRRYVGLRQELIAISQFSQSPEAFEPLPGDELAKLGKLQENMIFLGFMDLASVPQLSVFNGLWLIAFLCFGFSVVQVVVQRRIQKETMPNMPNSGMMKGLMVMGPAFALIIVFQFPAGAGLYWAISNLVMIAQSIIIFKVWPPERMRQEAKDRVQASVGTVDVTATVVDVDEEGNEVKTETKISDMSRREQEEYFKKKLEEARRADAEKYGDESDISLENNSEGEK
jgi:YidC/Oxa1 family membrane protein insertase